jgi:hypothetical protein
MRVVAYKSTIRAGVPWTISAVTGHQVRQSLVVQVVLPTVTVIWAPGGGPLR